MSKSGEKEKKDYETRLQRRLVLLKQQFEEGKIRIPNDARIEKSLMAIRYAPDGSVDLKTVDGLVRSMAFPANGNCGKTAPNETENVCAERDRI